LIKLFDVTLGRDYSLGMQTVSYKIVQTVEGHMIVTCPTDIYAWAEAIGRSVYHVPNLRLRPELQLQPRIHGFCGPMYDGEVGGVPVIRYEDQATNDILSV
jgi:hypothetical protein